MFIPDIFAMPEVPDAELFPGLPVFTFPEPPGLSRSAFGFRESVAGISRGICMFGSLCAGEGDAWGGGELGIPIPGMFSICCGDGRGEGDGADAGIFMPGIIAFSSVFDLGAFFFSFGVGDGLGFDISIPRMFCMSCVSRPARTRYGEVATASRAAMIGTLALFKTTDILMISLEIHRGGKTVASNGSTPRDDPQPDVLTRAQECPEHSFD